LFKSTKCNNLQKSYKHVSTCIRMYVPIFSCICMYLGHLAWLQSKLIFYIKCVWIYLRASSILHLKWDGNGKYASRRYRSLFSTIQCYNSNLKFLVQWTYWDLLTSKSLSNIESSTFVLPRNLIYWIWIQF